MLSVLIVSMAVVNQSFGQVTWKTFSEEKGLFSIEIPSNWYPEVVPESQKLTPIDYLFRYADRGNSFAWIELLISKSIYSDARAVAESYISEYQQFDDFILLKPIDCNTYILNDSPACSFLSSQQLEGEERRNILDIISTSPNGIQTYVSFITSSDIYDSFLPVGEYAINSIKIDSNNVNEMLNDQSTLDMQSEIPQIPLTSVQKGSNDSSGLDIPQILQSPNEANGSETIVYENPNLGFSLEYPSNWTKEESLSPPSLLLYSPRLSATDEAPESMAITTEVVSSDTSLKEYSNSALNVLRTQFPSMNLLETSNSTLSAYPANQIIYTYFVNGVELKNMQVWTIVNDMVYVITYGGTLDEFNDSLPVFHNMVNSFRITTAIQ